METNTRALYLDLLKKTVAGQVVEDSPKAAITYRWFDYLKRKRFDPALRETGKDWPSLAHTMIGAKRLNNLQHCIEDVLSHGVPGDLIETGVWRGGATIFMRGILKAYGVNNRRVWVADSFAGLPRPNAKRYPLDRWWRLDLVQYLKVSEDEVRANFHKYGLLDDQVQFLKGWFRDSLPSAPIESLAVLRMDGDLYESTIDALTNLYPKLSPGGYAIVDDYFLQSCAQAVSDYRKAHGITEPIIDIDGMGVYWQRAHA